MTFLLCHLWSMLLRVITYKVSNIWKWIVRWIGPNFFFSITIHTHTINSINWCFDLLWCKILLKLNFVCAIKNIQTHTEPWGLGNSVFLMAWLVIALVVNHLQENKCPISRNRKEDHQLKHSLTNKGIFCIKLGIITIN